MEHEQPTARGLAPAKLPLFVVGAAIVMIVSVLWFWETAQEKRARERPERPAVSPLERESASRDEALQRIAAERRQPFLIEARHGVAQGTVGAFKQRAIGQPFDPLSESAP